MQGYRWISTTCVVLCTQQGQQVSLERGGLAMWINCNWILQRNGTTSLTLFPTPPSRLITLYRWWSGHNKAFGLTPLTRIEFPRAIDHQDSISHIRNLWSSGGHQVMDSFWGSTIFITTRIARVVQVKSCSYFNLSYCTITWNDLRCKFQGGIQIIFLFSYCIWSSYLFTSRLEPFLCFLAPFYFSSPCFYHIRYYQIGF
ncbi:hypothetical protein L873DRAFT_441047 [Choiromyces venosus 120613-1]|uniref:Uncharacterized protein n=1 Tax=Choiromyces venosus 120613-1 TaxID=1336337 RepID=A0A3N4J013_9PEZI|nr:hypothetical protein L873DRAFT_441047 [Choiromyces venosus 120613-1]